MNKLIDHIFTKETFINGIKANYNDLIWILQNITPSKGKNHWISSLPMEG